MSTRRARCIVYIVDDDELVRKGLARVMRAGGFTPKAYENPELFLKEVVQDAPACILLDITMPRMTGLQVQATLKARSITIPVIAVSARDDGETRLRARELDARCFFRKPVDDQALLDAISWVAQLQDDYGTSEDPAPPEDVKKEPPGSTERA